MNNLQTALLKLNKNLNILQERQAKFGGNAPLELINQIEDHCQAISLTRQAITGELSVDEWRAALKPLLLAFQEGQVVTVEAGTYLAGDVRGDAVGGDKIVTTIYQAPPPPLPLAEAADRRNLTILLGKVKQFWIEGVLEKSVHMMALIDLGKETQAQAVAHAWEQVLELPDQSRQTLPPDKKISQIFDEMNRAMLILGVPGSGKTITLLQLARDLIAQAEQDSGFSQPVPVIFNLSTWTRGQPLIDWLVAELSAKYQIPKRLGRPWLENNRLLPLLDGLDEVRPEDRSACVAAINQFGAEFGLSGLVVCSRLVEYTSLPVRLRLNGAIRLQPLTLAQVYDYLDAAGGRLEVLRAALAEDEELKRLAQTPLTLGIMSLAYQDMPAEYLAGQAPLTLEARRRQLFDTYIERMCQRKGQGGKPCPDCHTLTWLAQLARGMLSHNQNIFLIEQLQPSWLSGRQWLWLYILAPRLLVTLLVAPLAGLAVGKSSTRLLHLEMLIPGAFGFLVLGLMAGLMYGGVWGLIDGLRYERQAKNVDLAVSSSRRQHALNVAGSGLLFGIVTALLAGLFTKSLLAGLLAGLVVGAAGGVGLELRNSRRDSLANDIQTVEALSWSWTKARQAVLLALAGGFVAGLIANTLVYSYNHKLAEFLLAAPWVRTFIEEWGWELGFTLSGGLFWAAVSGAIAAMFGGLTSRLVETKTYPNQGILLSAKNALLTGPVFGLIITLIFWGLGRLMLGSQNGWDLGIFFGVLLGIGAVLLYGGFDIVQHYILRFILWYQGHLPLNLNKFLDYTTRLIFLQKVGGGYIFIHRLLLEHFAAMDAKSTEVN
ncbi:MAG: hypothetical protein KJ077_36830 [Anaerolineae bacterium]|nr:hypothetical protein [Anaerolineae bacterium]